MITKQDHLAFIRQKGKFPIDCKTNAFSNDEIEYLEKYGNWLTALVTGVLEPITELQREFIVAADGKQDPFLPAECTWRKYLDQKKHEKRRKSGQIHELHLPEDAFNNREMMKATKKIMFKVMTENHKK